MTTRQNDQRQGDPPDTADGTETAAERHAAAELQRQLEKSMAFGKELRRRRINAGFRYVKSLATAAGISLPYLSQIEKGWRVDNGKPVELSDEKMKKISELLDWPLHEIYEVLGKIPAQEGLFSVSRLKLLDEFAKLSEAERLEIIRQLLNAMPGGEQSKQPATPGRGRIKGQ